MPARLLDQLGYGACITFIRGRRTYPGWAPAHFALYTRAKQFGATAHVMVARVDEGPIVGALMFPIPTGACVASLEGMAYARLSYLFWTLAKPLATCSEPLPELAAAMEQGKVHGAITLSCVRFRWISRETNLIIASRCSVKTPISDRA